MSDVAVLTMSEPSAKTNAENNVEEMEMDVSENAVDKNHCDDDAEEGEISDSRDTDEDNVNADSTGLSTLDVDRDHVRHYEDRAGSFITGIDLFGKEEQQKLEERAKRFGLDQVSRQPTEQQMKELYDSLNMKLSEGMEKSYRLNAVHMRGTENLSTQDVFAYFEDYAPSFIEWISDFACNVVWLNELSAARALVALSQPIAGLEAYHATANPFSKKNGAEEDNSKDEESKDANEGDKEEVVMVVAEIEGEGGENDIMVVDKQKENVEETHKSTENSLESKSNGVKATDIKVPIPPGRWRKGVDHPKSKCILLRFSTRSDKKFAHNEKLSEYYKKHGNPKYGGMKGLITASRKRRYQHESEFPVKMFDDDVGDERDFADGLCEEDSKNPWGGLAKSWHRLDKTRGKQPEIIKNKERESPPLLLPRRDIIVAAASRREVRNTSHHNSNRPVFERLGHMPQKPVAQSSESEESESSSSDDEHWSRRSKAPRMRMYADEEEVRLEQRRMQVKLQVSSRRSLSPEDLRSRLERSGRAQEGATRNLPSVWSRLRPVEERRSRSREEQRRSRSREEERQSRSRSRDDRSSSSSSSSGSSSSTDSGSDSASASDSGSVAGSDVEDAPVVRKGVVDLRTKLNMKKSLRQPQPVSVSVRQKSPLRIEIDNDEYYRLIGSD